ncbi:helix-turn-helix domain-containing protein [Paraburkholderia sacchari]|uniref:helix-turn-helix domain-containing protein n=1 Tax=Paraburkholderia sacchari TaxID=159450 RepID=UPI001FD098F7|nr:helix-turn-helix domain-containing protein [Paraburkholderia sacchari]
MATTEKPATKRGRRTAYRPEYVEQAAKLTKLGAIDSELADFFGVSEQTLNTWKKRYPEFLESIKSGKSLADAEIADSLFNRAKGYEHDDLDLRVIGGKLRKTKITKHYPPDTTAAIFWLKNRQPEKWRDVTKTEITGRNGGPIETHELSDAERASRITALLDAARARRAGQAPEGEPDLEPASGTADPSV